MDNVLVIDDEIHAFLAIKKIIDWKKYNLNIHHVKNGEEGLKTMYELEPKIVFVDMNMPIMDGITFLEKVNNKFKSTSFIIVSGYDDFKYTRSAIVNGACEYLLKPIVKEDLISIVKKILGDLDKCETVLDNDILVVVYEIKSYIETNYAKDIKVSDFAIKYFFTKEYISKIFRREFEIGIYEYVLKLRMERAKELLSNKNLKVSEISERLGYNNSNYFSKAFKNYYGVPPSEL